MLLLVGLFGCGPSVDSDELAEWIPTSIWVVRPEQREVVPPGWTTAIVDLSVAPHDSDIMEGLTVIWHLDDASEAVGVTPVTLSPGQPLGESAEAFWLEPGEHTLWARPASSMFRTMGTEVDVTVSDDDTDADP